MLNDIMCPLSRDFAITLNTVSLFALGHLISNFLCHAPLGEKHKLMCKLITHDKLVHASWSEDISQT